MATPAATLQILVDANTRSAVTSLNKLDRQLTGIDKTTATATTRTSALGSASKRAGSHLASAARYAAGAAVAYLSIAQAKAAVTTTQDLAKTTAGLNRNLGMTVKEGSRWAAVAKSRDIDAKSLTMSFTVLSRRVVEAGHAIREGGGAAETAMVPFTRLGLSQRDVLAGSKNLSAFLPQLADAFGEAEGGAKRQASAQQLLGRGYATILPLFADGAKGLKEQQMWADKYGATLSGPTLKAQMDLVSAQRESKVAMLGLQVSFAQFITPALQKANEEFQKLSAIMGDDKLTNAEKFEKVGAIIEKWADKVLDAFVAVLPKIVERAGEAAPRIAGALVKGFLAAPIWGQMLLGGWFLSKLGGLGGMGGIGTKLGTRFGMSFGGAAGPIAAGMVLSALAGAEVGKGLDIGQTDIGEMFAEELGIARGEAERLVTFMERNPGLGAEEALGVMRHQARLTSGTWSEVWHKIANVTDDRGQDAFQNWEHWLGRINSKGESEGQRFRNVLGGLFGDVAGKADKEGGDAFRYWDQWLGKTASNGQTTSRRFKNQVAGNFERLADTAIGAIAALAGETNKTLSSLKVKGQVYVGRKIGGGKGGTVMAQKGAIVGGSTLGDRHTLSLNGVPIAKVESGEKIAVVNREAAKREMALNAIVPRFQAGGMVDPAGPGTGIVNKTIANVVGAWSRRYDAAINYGYDPGGGHVSPGHNVTGTATDTGPAAGWGSGPTALFERGLRAITGKVEQILYGSHGVGTPYPNHGFGNHAHIEWGMHPDVKGALEAALSRYVLEGPKGPLRDAGQSAIDMVRQAASKFVSSRMGGIGGGDLTSFGGKGTLSKTQLVELWKSVNPGIGNANLMAAVALAESSGSPSVTNSIGARGLWQIIPSTAAAFGLDYGRLTDPAYNALGAGKILQGQGLGAWEAYTNGNYAQYLQKGGLVGMQAGGIVGDIRRTQNQIKTVKTQLGEDQLTDKDRDRIGEIKELLKKKGLPGERRRKLQGELSGLQAQAGQLEPNERQELQKRQRELEKELQRLRDKLAKHRERQAGKISRKGLHPELLEKLRTANDKITEFTELLNTADQLAGLSTSESGEEYGPGELAKLFGLYGDGSAIGLLDWHVRRRDIGHQQVDAATERLTQIEKELSLKDLPSWRRAALQTNRKNAKQLRRDAHGVVVEEEGVTGSGGFIFDTQMEIAALGGRTATGPSVLDSMRAGLLAEQVEALRRELALSKAQMPVFGGVFHNGGVVPGPIGQERTIIAQGGETVGGMPEIRVIVEDGAVDPSKIRVEVVDTLNEIARKSAPGKAVVGQRSVLSR